MSVTELKTIMHRRIDQIGDEDTVHDLFATMNSFLEGRFAPALADSPELTAQLAQTLAKIEAGEGGISTAELKDNIRQWRTR